MTDDPKLTDEVAWKDDGHVTDVVVTALADGQREIVPLAAYAHVHRCATCSDRLGQAALFASMVDEALIPESCPADLPEMALVATGSDDALADTVLATELAVVESDAVSAVASGARELAPASGRRLPLPIPALAAALVVAGLGATPTVLELVPQAPQIFTALVERIPGFLRTVAVLVRTALGSDGSMITVAWAAAGIVLLTFGLLITRLLPLQSKGETP
jgi:hypothetical protein